MTNQSSINHQLTRTPEIFASFACKPSKFQATSLVPDCPGESSVGARRRTAICLALSVCHVCWQVPKDPCIVLGCHNSAFSVVPFLSFFSLSTWPRSITFRGLRVYPASRSRRVNVDDVTNKTWMIACFAGLITCRSTPRQLLAL